MAANSTLRTAVGVTFATVSNAAHGTIVSIAKRTTATSGRVTDTLNVQAQLVSAAPDSVFTSITSGGVTKSCTIAAANNVFHMLVSRWDSTNFTANVDNGAFTSIAAGAVDADTNQVLVGRTTVRGLTLRLVAWSPLALSNTTITKFYSWALASGYLT